MCASDGRADGDAGELEPVQRRRRRGRRRPRSVSFGSSRYVVSYDNPVELKPMTVCRRIDNNSNEHDDL